MICSVLVIRSALVRRPVGKQKANCLCRSLGTGSPQSLLCRKTFTSDSRKHGCFTAKANQPLEGQFTRLKSPVPL